MNNKNIFVLGLVIVLIFFGYLAIVKKGSPETNNIQFYRVDDDYVKDSSWLTYTDEKYPISFDYPANGVVQVRTEGTEAEYNVIVGKRRGSDELEDNSSTTVTESIDEKYESQYSIWFSLVPKTKTPTECINQTTEGREYTNRNIGQSTVYKASGSNTGENYNQWSVVCIDIPDQNYFLSLTTSDFSNSDFVQKVTDSISFVQ